MSGEGMELPAAASTSEGVGQRVDEGKGRIFPCESCGADLEFHIGQQNLKCPFCGFSKDLTPDEEDLGEQKLDEMLDRLVELRREGAEKDLETEEVTCGACGAPVEFAGTLTSTDCPYCGSPIQRENVHKSEHRVPVDGVLPFKIERQRAHDNLRRWVKSRWFAPNEFKKRGAAGKFSGVYLPFWTFDAMTFTRYRGQRGDAYFVSVNIGKSRQRKRKLRWSPVSGSFQRFFDDVLVAATRLLPDKLLRALEPWPLDGCLPFNQELLAGYFARTYDIPLDAGLVDARQRIDQAIRAEVRQRIGGDGQRIQRVLSRYEALTYKHLLLPVWLLSYTYGAKTYQVVVNAGTGQVHGERPYSAVKIALFVIFCLIVVLIFATG